MLPELEIENLSHEELLMEAKQRRRSPTKAEKLLWHRLCRRRMMGFYFSRHSVRKNFIFDFYCRELKLIVEVDYSVDNLLKEYYEERDMKLRELGYQVLRFKNDHVLDDFSSVINRIEEFIVILRRSKRASEVSNYTSKIEPYSYDDKHPTRAAGGKGLINQGKPAHFPVSRQTRNLLIEQAREMRKHPTKAEVLLWEELRAKQLAGYKFRRQHPIGSFIVDFYCPLRKLVIEIDGPVHNNQKAYDKTREDYLQAMGFTVLRFANQKVEDHMSDVLQEILTMLTKMKEK